jgi:hypothetical protein
VTARTTVATLVAHATSIDITSIAPLGDSDTVAACSACSCLFVPMVDGDLLYPDRYAAVSQRGVACTDDQHCDCHNFAYEIQTALPASYPAATS